MLPREAKKTSMNCRCSLLRRQKRQASKRPSMCVAAAAVQLSHGHGLRRTRGILVRMGFDNINSHLHKLKARTFTFPIPLTSHSNEAGRLHFVNVNNEHFINPGLCTAGSSAQATKRSLRRRMATSPRRPPGIKTPLWITLPRGSAYSSLHGKFPMTLHKQT